MKILPVIALILAAPAAAAAQEAQEAQNPVGAFLMAADAGDEAAMLALLNTPKLPKELAGCYLRRVYKGPDSEIIPAWMCADGDNASRVVLGELTASGSTAQLKIVHETRSARPAPARTGSAIPSDPAPEAQK